jgi:hypothetical protein
MDGARCCWSAFCNRTDFAHSRAGSNQQASISRGIISIKRRPRMAEKSKRNKSTDELSANVARSRERVGRELRGLRYELDFLAKLRSSFHEHTASWLTAAAAVGVLIVLLPMRKKKIYVGAESGRKTKKKLAETGFALGALNIGAGLIRPVVVAFVKNRLTSTAGGPRTRSR